MQASAAAWQRLEADSLASLADRIAATEKPEQNFRRLLLKQLKVQPDFDYALWLSGAWYSRALNDWGTLLQRQGQFPEAGNAFRRARDLKPDNLPAIVNLFCNTNLIARRRLEVDTTRSPETALGRYRDWEEVLNENGSFDAPEFSFGVGQFFMANGLYRQSAQQFYRVTDLVPGFISAEIALANIDTALGRYDQALSRVADIRASRIFTNLTVLGRTELDLVDAAVWLGKSDLVQADQRIAAILAANPTNLSVMDRVFSLHIGKQRHTNALDLVQRQLELAPNNDRYLVNKSYLWLQMGLFSNSIPVLTQVLTKDSDNFQARFNRAIAYLNTAQLDEAREDYEALEEVAPENAQVQYGLAEVAWRQHRTNATIVHLSNYLSNAPPGTAEAKLVEARLEELQRPRR
jgi:tetratricopeptide (TPR) repeat protein